MTVQNFANDFLKSFTLGTFLWNYFEIRPAVSEKSIISKISSRPYSASSHHSRSVMFINGTKFREQFLKKGHQRNTSVKLFQNLTSGFREEEFLENFFISIQCKLVPSIHRRRVYWQIKICEQFLKRSTKEYLCEIISKADQRFQRRRFFKNFFMSVYCK